MSVKHKLEKPIKVDGDTVHELTLKPEVIMEDIISAHKLAMGQPAKIADIYLTFRMWGLDVKEGESLHVRDFVAMDTLLAKLMAGPSEKDSIDPSDGSGA